MFYKLNSIEFEVFYYDGKNYMELVNILENLDMHVTLDFFNKQISYWHKDNEIPDFYFIFNPGEYLVKLPFGYEKIFICFSSEEFLLFFVEDDLIRRRNLID